MGRQRFKCELAIATLVRSTSLLTVKSVLRTKLLAASLSLQLGLLFAGARKRLALGPLFSAQSRCI